MSIGSETVLSAVLLDGNPDLLSGVALEENLQAATGVWDLVEVSAAEIKLRVLNVPKTRYHVRVEFENGQDRYLSVDRRFWKERDDLRTYKGVEVYNVHLDSSPCTPGNVGDPFEGGFDRLEHWIGEQEARQ